ncbi:MAG: biotin--[acetyl-CoA-carboxylase] ligase [Planctomycetaceae bacterium]|nr:biotin--[acetyl-CoA-carboxylase] ligase [Planctomycetaceae bacterium]
MIDPLRVERETFVAQAEVHAELPSTNDRALRLAASSSELPRLIVALRQTLGRGRGANRWWSTDGGLTFSLIVNAAPIDIERRPLIGLVAGGAVCEAVATAVPGSDVRLKWPNDVFVDGGKACGILVEVPPDAPDRLVIGVGLNVNVSLREAPDDVRRRARALCDVAGRALDLGDLLVRFLQKLDADLQRLDAGFGELLSDWRRRCLLSGRCVKLNDGTRSVTGTCLGFDDDGSLLLQTVAGPRRFRSGVIEEFE